MKFGPIWITTGKSLTILALIYLFKVLLQMWPYLLGHTYAHHRHQFVRHSRCQSIPCGSTIPLCHTSHNIRLPDHSFYNNLFRYSSASLWRQMTSSSMLSAEADDILEDRIPPGEFTPKSPISVPMNIDINILDLKFKTRGECPHNLRQWLLEVDHF